MPAKKQIRGGPNKAAPQVQPPVCEKDRVPMTFDPVKSAWICDVCGKQLYASVDLDQFGGPPIVAEGPLELMIYKAKDDGDNERTYVLRSTASNIVVDITPYVRRTMPIKGGRHNGQTMIEFVVDRVVRTDGDS